MRLLYTFGFSGWFLPALSGETRVVDDQWGQIKPPSWWETKAGTPFVFADSWWCLFFSQIKMSEMPMYGTSAKKEYVQEFGRFKHVSRSFQVVSSYSIHEDDFLIPKRGKVVPGAPWFCQRSIGVVPCTYIYIYIYILWYFDGFHFPIWILFPCCSICKHFPCTLYI